VPYGTDSRWNGSQAINCLATIIRSLRDGAISRTDSSPKAFGRERRCYGTGISLGHLPGNKLPGLRRAQSSRYDHIVPPGQKRLTCPAAGSVLILLPLRFEICATDLKNDRIGRFYQNAFAWYCPGATLREFRNGHIRMANSNLLNCRRCDP
jgi:hypothetical protein